MNFTTPEGLIQRADNKVWLSIFPSSELQEMQEKYIISSAIHRSDGVHARIVSDFRPSQNAVLLPSTLEDAYLYAVSPLGGAS